MKLDLVRHGQTDWNIQCKAQGQTDIPLNETGIRQARQLRDRIRDWNYDLCYCSPLKRAALTAQIIVDGRCRIVMDDDLKERGFGRLEGTNSGNWKADFFDRRLNLDTDGIEPIRALLARSERMLEKIRKNHSDSEKILVVGHGTMLKAMHFCITGYDDDTDFHSFRFENVQIEEYDI